MFSSATPSLLADAAKIPLIVFFFEIYFGAKVEDKKINKTEGPNTLVGVLLSPQSLTIVRHKGADSRRDKQICTLLNNKVKSEKKTTKKERAKHSS